MRNKLIIIKERTIRTSETKIKKASCRFIVTIELFWEKIFILPFPILTW